MPQCPIAGDANARETLYYSSQVPHRTVETASKYKVARCGGKHYPWRFMGPVDGPSTQPRNTTSVILDICVDGLYSRVG